MSGTNSPLSAFALAALVVLAIAIMHFRGSTIIAGWSILKMICGAAMLIPLGSVLIAIAVWIVSTAGANWLAVLAALWFAYTGLNVIFGALAGFTGSGPSMIDTGEGATTATRAELRQARLLRRSLDV
jgi:hypothetical protein